MLPPSPVDNQIIVDDNSRYIYHNPINNWMYIGDLVNSNIVNYVKNGLVFPELKQLISNVRNADIQDFKILNASRYYNLLLDKNKLFIFTVEGNNLRIELNRSALTNLLTSKACRGFNGPDGETGLVGRNGLPGPKENTYYPIINNEILEFSGDVPSVLDTQISIRLYNLDNLIEIWCINSSWEIISNNTDILIDKSSIITYDGMLYLKLIANKNWGNGWTLKARQRGPKGYNGVDGNQFVDITETFSDVKSSNLISSINRFNYNLTTSTQRLSSDLTVSHLGLFNSMQCEFSSITDPIYPTKIAALAPSGCNSNSHSILRWMFIPNIINLGILDLPSWIPEPCGTTRYNWYSSVNADVKIREAPVLPKKCCQEDFFFCPSLGGVCSVQQGASPPTPPGPPVITISWNGFTSAQWDVFSGAQWDTFISG